MIRRVEKKDFFTLYNWVNDEEVIKNSRYQKKQSVEEYEQWFHGKMKDHKSYMFILEEEKRAIGQINFVIDSGEVIITYSIDKNYRGKGWGTKLISYVEEFVEKEVENCNKMVAYISASNIPSIKVFEKLGYKYEVDEKYYKKMYKGF